MKSFYALSLLLSVGLATVSCHKLYNPGVNRNHCSIEQFASHPYAQRYQQELGKYKTENSLPGAIIAIKKSNETLWVGATGKANLYDDADIKPCTPFRIGSITKVFTAVLIMKLKEQGKIGLEDKLSNWLPELNGNIPHADMITIRMLLNHTNGIIDPKNDDSQYLQDIRNNPVAIDKLSINEKLQKYVYGKPLFFTPGTASHYSNTGYWLLGKIIEKITKKEMHKVMDDLIFKPLSLRGSYYDKRDNPSVAHGYFMLEDSLVDVTIYDRADGDGDPSSGVISTAADLINFGEALFNGKLISSQSLQEMNTTTKFPGCPNGDCGYGLGIETYDIGSNAGFGKNGSSIGYEANWIYIPHKKTSIVVFANKGGGTYKTFLERILD